jgi:hypothetical protein
MTSRENFEIIYKEYAPTIRKLCLSYTGNKDNFAQASLMFAAARKIKRIDETAMPT